MRTLAVVNAVLALVVELALLAAAVAVGVLLPAPIAVRIVVAVALPVALVVTWSLLLAPRAPRRVAPRGRVLLQAALLAVAVVALATLGAVPWALALTGLGAVRLALGARTGLV